MYIARQRVPQAQTNATNKKYYQIVILLRLNCLLVVRLSEALCASKCEYCA